MSGYFGRTYKAQLMDYDFLLAESDDECCYSLSYREVQIILANLDYIGWKTRYLPTDTTIDQDTIDQWQAGLARKLMSGCCPDDGQLNRFTEDGTFQTSDDGGTTWTDNPDSDPRNQAVQNPPLPGTDGDGKRCAAADNVESLFTQYRDNLNAMIDASPTLVSVIAGILAFIAVITGVSGAAIGISVILMGLASALLTLSHDGVVAVITDTVLDDFRCLVYCRMDNDGRLTYDQWKALLADIADTFADFPELFFYQTVNAMGYIGMNNAGSTGVATASDCGDCDCPVECGDPALVTIGTVTASGIDGDGRKYLHIQSAAFSTFQNISIGTYGAGVPPNTCCHIYGWGIISGAVNSTGYTDCSGGVHDPGNPETHDCGHATWNTAPGDSTPFEISVTFGT